MKKMRYGILCSMLFAISITYTGIFDYLGFKNSPTIDNQTKIRLPLGINEKKEQLDRLKKDLTEVQATEKEFAQTIQRNIDQTTSAIQGIKTKIASASAQDLPFLNKELSILNETYQTLVNLQLSRKELLATMEQHSNVLENFLKDPEFKSLSLKAQSFYTFIDLQEINKKIAAQESKLAYSIEQKNEASIDLDNAKRKINALSKEYQEKKKKQAEFSTKGNTAEPDADFQHLGKQLDLEKNFASFEMQLAELKVQALTRKVVLLDTNSTLESEKLKILRANQAKIREAIRIEQKDVTAAKEKLDLEKKESLNIRDGLYSTIKELSTQREAGLKELEILKKRYTLGDIALVGLPDWSTTPQTVNDWVRLCEIGLKEEQVALLENKIDALRTTIELEVTKFKRKELDFAILTSWFKITRRQFKTNDEILQELKYYQGLLSETIRDESVIKDKRNSLTNLINSRNKIYANLKNLIVELKAQKTTTFKSASNKYSFCLTRLNQVQKVIEEQLEKLNELFKNYTDLISMTDNVKQQVTNIIGELETKSIWQRSEYAISFNGIKNIGPDLWLFITDLKKLFTHYFSNLYTSTRSLLNRALYHPFDLIVFILKGIFVTFLYWYLRNRLQAFILYLRKPKEYPTALYVASKVGELVVTFAYRYFTRIFIWFVLFSMIYFEYISDSFLRVLFYLGSIVFFGYLAYRFIRYTLFFNEKNEYVLFGAPFQPRFIFVFSLFSYLTIILLFFREAFIAATYHVSEFPTILLALYSIVIRTLIIFSIGKDEILSFIPKRGSAWNRLSEFIDRYYYPLLCCIILLMLMSDPYIGGYGNLVSYVLWGVIGTGILIKVLLLIQDYIKKKASTVFFSVDEETIRERFSSAKTWYGLFVVVLFFSFVLIGLIISLKLWGKAITLKDLQYMLNFELFSTGFDSTKQQHIWLTPLKIISIVGFIMAGFLLAFAINRFVLHRIFQLLPVDIGIQNTVSSLIRYLVIVAAIFLGFQWGGLGSLLIAIGLIIGSIGYIVKEPIGDFISYFIILVQRPLKIGDLVRIQDTQGVVRHVTPRSVIIRVKNSYTVIMPNTMVINQPVLNWNYTRGFIAFDDISFTVPYDVDPIRVKNIVAEVVDKNPDILKSPRPIIRLENFGDNGYEFMLRGFLSSNKTLDIWDIASDVRFTLIQALQKQGISIAIPTRSIITRTIES